MNTNIVIWGTGRIGNVAYFYYKDICNICGYIDNDNRKWGKEFNGIKVYSPGFLKEINAKVVIAMRGGADSVAKQLREEYGIREYSLFQPETLTCLPLNDSDRQDEICEDTCIVHFNGGLGNQMFQYAFYKTLHLNGKKVLAYSKTDIETSICYLSQVFKDIDLKMCTETQRKNLIEKNMKLGQRTKKFIIYSEENTNETKIKNADVSIINATGGIFWGLFQTYRFAEKISKSLRKDFKFDISCERQLGVIGDYIVNHDTVGIHIRRGDYLIGNNIWAYGNICTMEYYEKALLYFKKKIKDCKFIFFSNDIEWVKENYKMSDAMYIENNMFDNYQDWYDMYLMSICKHNIIANSTFSWWGAWLNQNKNKIVIAPKKWVNLCDYTDIYLEDWIQM